MSKFDKYRVNNLQESSVNKPISKFDKYRIMPTVAKEGDSWLQVPGKALGKFGTELAGVPHLISKGMESITNAGNKMYGAPVGMYGMGTYGQGKEAPPNIRIDENAPQTDYAELLPSSESIQKAIQPYVDIEPRPSNAGQRIAYEGADWALNSLLPFGPANKVVQGVNKVAKGTSLLNNFNKVAKTAGTGAAIGATSGIAQEAGAPKLAADIGSAIGFPLVTKGVKGAGNLLYGLSNAGQQKQIKNAASDILREHTGEKNIQKVLDNFNTPIPFNAELTTADLAQNTGISGLHRTLAPNIPAIAEKEAISDSIIRKQLNQLSPKTGLEPTEQGESIRNYLSQELANRKQTRSNVTEPLYEEVNKLKQGIDLPNTQTFLKREGEFAKGDIKNNLNYIEDIIRSNAASKGDIGKFNKLYGNLGAQAVAQLEKEVLGQPVAAEITNALKDINGRIGAARKSGNNEVVRVLSEAKSNILADMAMIPEEAVARSTYAKLSKPVSAIEREPLLGKMVKQDINNGEFLTSPEQIPDMILRGTLNNTKALVSEVGKDKKTMDIIRGSMVDKLLNTSELASVNSLGQQNLSYNKVNNFLKKNKGKLQYIFDKDQIKVFDDVKDLLKRRNMVATMGRGVGSNTQSQTTLLEDLFDPVKKSIATKVLNQIPGGKYITPLYGVAKDYEKQQIKNLLGQALTDPNIARQLLTPVNVLKNEQNFIRINAPAILNREIQRSQQEGE